MMRRILLFYVSVCLLLSTTALLGGEGPRLPSVGTHGDRVARLVVPREIKVLYKTLAALPYNEQRMLLFDISPAVKAQLWEYNLQMYVREHRALSEAQRDAIESAFDLLENPRLFDPVEAGSPEWNLRHDALSLYKHAADALFSREARHPLFMRLGPEPPASVEADGFAIKPASGAGMCNCQTRDPAAECQYGGGAYCYDGLPGCTPWMGCGYWGLDACDGFCL
jgi:hypothetical protein